MILGAGLQGVAKGYELGPATEDDVWSLTETERKAMGYESLPQNLTEALAAMEHSELVAEVLGEHVFDFFLRNKRAEWDAYRRQVTPYELSPTCPSCSGERTDTVGRCAYSFRAGPDTSVPTPSWP